MKKSSVTQVTRLLHQCTHSTSPSEIPCERSLHNVGSSTSPKLLDLSEAFLAEDGGKHEGGDFSSLQ